MSIGPRKQIVTAALAVACLAVPAAAHADVQITMHDGRVSVKATNATVREILAEWAKVGQAKIVNGDRLTGSPVTLELTDVTESQALDVLLRTVAGYMAAPRPAPAPNASQFDRIMILPTSTPPRAAAAPPPQPTFPQPQFTPQLPPDDDDDPRAVPVPGQRGPVFNTFPQPGTPPGPQPAGVPPNFPVYNPFNQQPPRPATPPPAAPGGQMPVGVSVPGMIVPQPTPQPGQIQIPPQ